MTLPRCLLLPILRRDKCRYLRLMRFPEELAENAKATPWLGKILNAETERLITTRGRKRDLGNDETRYLVQLQDMYVVLYKRRCEVLYSEYRGRPMILLWWMLLSIALGIRWHRGCRGKVIFGLPNYTSAKIMLSQREDYSALCPLQWHPPPLNFITSALRC